MTQRSWKPISTAPMNAWLRTKCEGEDGENICAARKWEDGEIEWVERNKLTPEGKKILGRTTVTHSSFAPPTHWDYIDILDMSVNKEP